jgi:hypothetical protein
VPFSFGGTAREHIDFRLLTENPLVIKAGTQSAGITVSLIDNEKRDGNKTIELLLDGAADASHGAILKQTITINDDDRIPRIAVVPFYNLSPKKNAGEMMALHFIRRLNGYKDLQVTEPGVVRDKLLDLRIIMDDGVSLADADIVFEKLDVDLILTGRVLDYIETEGRWGSPLVDFSVLVIGRKERAVIWHSRSRNKGDQGVFLFDWGLLKTTDELARRMVGSVVHEMMK